MNFKPVINKLIQAIGYLPFVGNSVTEAGERVSPKLWLESLKNERREVMDFSAKISRDFTEHSQTLEGLIEDIEKLKKACQAVIGIISSEEGETPVQFSYHLFKKSEDIIQASFDQFRVIFESVRILKEQIKNVESNQYALSKITLPLKMITVQYRITASMMDEQTRQEFYDLADKLTALITEINRRIDQQFQDLSETSGVCSAIISDLDAMVAEYDQQINEQLGTSKNSLNHLSDSLESSHELIDSISKCSESLSEGVFSIIVSMQTQDMTSQKLEHICAAIDSICERLEDSENGNFKQSLYFAREASKIQTSQLKYLFKDLEAATASIRSTTQTTEAEVEKIASATEQLSNVGNQADLLRDSAESVRQILRFVETTIDRTRGVLLSIKPLRDKFTDSTSKVMHIAAEMRMVAINAQVYAASVSDGEALEVLSHSTQSQSLDAKHAIEAISHSLEQVAVSLNSTEESLSRFTELGQMDMDQLLDESAIAQEELQKLEKELPAKLNEIQRSRAVVTKNTRAFAERLDIGDELKTKARHILELFHSISTAHIGDLPEAIIAQEQKKISSLKTNYTMNCEVQVHDHASKGISKSFVPTKNQYRTGSNAFDSFEDFSLSSPQNPIPNADDASDSIDLFEVPSPREEKPKTGKTEKLDDNIDLF